MTIDKMDKQLKIFMKTLFSIIYLLLIMAGKSYGKESFGKITFEYGFYSLNATVENKAVTVSGPYAYHVSFLKHLFYHIELNVGYTVLFSELTGGDMSYGLNLGANYYFLSKTNNQYFDSDEFQVVNTELWRPFIGAGFYQKNFQSIKNSFSGLGINFGAERRFNDDISWRGEIRYIQLAGTGNSTATELNFLFGIVLSL